MSDCYQDYSYYIDNELRSCVMSFAMFEDYVNKEFYPPQLDEKCWEDDNVMDAELHHPADKNSTPIEISSKPVKKRCKLFNHDFLRSLYPDFVCDCTDLEEEESEEVVQERERRKDAQVDMELKPILQKLDAENEVIQNIKIKLQKTSFNIFKAYRLKKQLKEHRSNYRYLLRDVYHIIPHPKSYLVEIENMKRNYKYMWDI